MTGGRAKDMGGNHPDSSYISSGGRVHAKFMNWRHVILGTTAKFADAAARAPFENLKTAIQLERVYDLEDGLQRFNPDNIYLGFSTNVTKFIVDYTCTRLVSSHFDKYLINTLRIGIPYSFQGSLGAILSALLNHPLDTIRTIEGELAYNDVGINTRAVLKKFSFPFFYFQPDVLTSLYNGLLSGVLYNWLQEVSLRTCEGLLTSPRLNQSLDNSSAKDIALKWALLSLTKIALTPLEVVRKHQQRKAAIDSPLQENTLDTMKRIYDNRGLSGLFSGWYLGIGEATCAVVVSHLVYVSCDSLWNKFVN
eukprot:TRINITY_DN5116_c0_g1_i1.p1 TRINITY_DN5116_c0_g1~~TRINITY_DN5116_c0_g1_i1.p1  ORF type:complete len:308 (+),score=83.53 TRINITY_DN5116_c0_g1_i1:106-1029(+)